MTITDTTHRTSGGAPSTTTTEATVQRIERLNTASQRRVIEPDTDVPGAVGEGRLVPRELSTLADLDVRLTEDQWAALSREEIASVASSGIRFEAVLMAGFSDRIANAPELVDPRVVYMLHEIGEETRHSRLFIRLIEQIDPQATDAFAGQLARFAFRTVTRRLAHRPAPLMVLVLAGEEIPDLLQKKLADHPDTDPFVRAVNKYHRMEEARHLSFARSVLPELWAEASPTDRWTVRYALPAVIRTMFEGMINPGVYPVVGLPAWATWRAMNASPSRVALRHEATSSVLRALVDGGVLRPGRIPVGWRRLCGVDRHGRPVAG